MRIIILDVLKDIINNLPHQYRVDLTRLAGYEAYEFSVYSQDTFRNYTKIFFQKVDENSWLIEKEVVVGEASDAKFMRSNDGYAILDLFIMSIQIELMSVLDKQQIKGILKVTKPFFEFVENM